MASQHQVVGVDGAVVLIVDDDSIIRRRLSAVLKRSGFDVRAAQDGTTALFKMAHEPADVVIVDYSMPDMDGITVLALMEQHWPSTARVLMSGVLDAPLARDAASGTLELHGALSKPVAPGELRRAVQAALDRR